MTKKAARPGARGAVPADATPLASVPPRQRKAKPRRGKPEHHQAEDPALPVDFYVPGWRVVIRGAGNKQRLAARPIETVIVADVGARYVRRPLMRDPYTGEQ